MMSCNRDVIVVIALIPTTLLFFEKKCFFPFISVLMSDTMEGNILIFVSLSLNDLNSLESVLF